MPIRDYPLNYRKGHYSLDFTGLPDKAPYVDSVLGSFLPVGEASVTADKGLSEELTTLRTRIEALEEHWHKSLSMLSNEQGIQERIARINVGTNDILVVYLNVTRIPPSSVSSYVAAVKANVESLFIERGLKDRVVWITTCERATGFDVIGVDRVQDNKSCPPVMG